LTNNSPSLTFGGATPDTVAFTSRKRIFKASDTNVTLVADFLGHVSLLVIIWKEDGRVKTVTGPSHTPCDIR
jgi:hypothetical protein